MKKVAGTPAEPGGEIKKPAVRKRAVRAEAPAKPVDQDVQAVSTRTKLVLDYPQPEELIVSRQYTLRFSTPEGTPAVDVSIDGGAWQACRFAVGHWWYDWDGYDEGPHLIRARAATEGGQLSFERSVRVSFSGQY